VQEGFRAIATISQAGGEALSGMACCNRRVRGAYKAVQNVKDLEKELPQCALGAMLLSWIKQVRGPSRRWWQLLQCVSHTLLTS
jgi:hypothetical protein